MGFNEILGLVMLASMIGVIFIGVPISFTLLFLAFIFGSIGIGPEVTFNLAYLQIWGTMKDDILPAVPLFIFMGYMTEQAGLMERLFLALRHLLAPVRGIEALPVQPDAGAEGVKESAKNSSSGSPQAEVKSRCAAFTITGAPQA